jgi:accessory gene regulator protein AgrB
MIPPDQAEIRRRQKSRAVIMGVLLAAFAILVYAITIAKMGAAR